MITADTPAALDFLDHWMPSGPWSLTSIDPANRRIETRTFSDADMARRWLDQRQGRLNLYFSVNQPKSSLHKKATKDDIGLGIGLHVDLDPPNGADLDETKPKLIAMLKNYRLPPTVIIDSGGGAQGFWRLREPELINGEECIAHFEALNQGIEYALGGDHCHNIDRVMRLPGTINIPDKKKLEKGRQVCVARLVEANWDQQYDLSDFEPAAKPNGHTEPPGTGKSGNGNGNGHDNSRSGAAFRLAQSMRSAGFNYEQFVGAARLNPETASWCREKGELNGHRELRRTWENAAPKSGASVSEGVTSEDFNAYLPMHTYIYGPTRAMWPATSVNSQLPPVPIVDKNGQPRLNDKGKPIFLTPAQWIDRNRPVHQMTWVPGEGEIIENRLLYEGGWIDKPGVRTFNQYLSPNIIPGDAASAGKWLAHIRFVYPDTAEHMLDWLAHRVQRPSEKINHALVMGGSQGIGKDTILEPVKPAIGPWNFKSESPVRILGRFNGYQKAVILLINEAHDLGDSDRFKFYDHMKVLIAGPPDTLVIDEKHLREYIIPNVCGVILTTNHKTDGIYLPAEDRRHHVSWSDRVKEDPKFAGDYWIRMYRYYQDGGNEAVAAYLQQRDISGFDPKAPPPKTPAFWGIADASRPSEESELADVLEKMRWPKAFTLTALQAQCRADKLYGLLDWLDDRKNRRVIPHRLEKCDYTPVRNPDDNTDGRWKHDGSRKVIYVKTSLSLRDQIEAAREMVKRAGENGP